MASLEQGYKIQLNMAWYRFKVGGPGRTQGFDVPGGYHPKMYTVPFWDSEVVTPNGRLISFQAPFLRPE